MFRVTRQIDFCYGHRLLNYDGKCKYLHGHNGRAIIALEKADLDGRGMVLDFTDIKRVVSGWIDANLDHRMLLHREDPIVPALTQAGEPMYLMEVNPTAENIARLIFDYAAGKGFPVIRVDLWETPNCYASYLGGVARKWHNAPRRGPCDAAPRSPFAISYFRAFAINSSWRIAKGRKHERILTRR